MLHVPVSLCSGDVFLLDTVGRGNLNIRPKPTLCSGYWPSDSHLSDTMLLHSVPGMTREEMEAKKDREEI